MPGAETALFDEKNGPVRLAAMRFMCKLAGTTEARSERIWPFIDEGIQCYHGDLEYQDMLGAVVYGANKKTALVNTKRYCKSSLLVLGGDELWHKADMLMFCR